MKAPILYSPMMGLGASLDVFAETPAVVIEDFMFESTTAYEITPLASGTVSDFHDAWDLDGTDFTPEASPDDEGYWDDFSNIITNGTFDTDSDWTKGTGWTISDGKAVATSCVNVNLVASASILIGNTYEVTFTVSDYSGSGTVKPMLGTVGAVSGTTVNANGTYTENLVADANQSTIAFRAGGTAFTGKIENVIVREYAIQPQDV